MELNSNTDHVNYALVRALGRTALVKIARSEGGGPGSVITSGLVGGGIGAVAGGVGAGVNKALKEMAEKSGKTLKEVKAMTPAQRARLIPAKGTAAEGKLVRSVSKSVSRGGKAGLLAGGLGLAGLTALTG